MDQRCTSIQAITQHLRIILRVVQAHSKYVEKECGLSSAKLWMLFEIGANPGLKVSELANALTIHPSTCSNMLDRLEDRDLVTRGRSKKDQRAVHVHLTEDGEKLLAKAPKPAQGKLSDALEKLPANQIVELETGLRYLIQALKNSSAGVAMMPLLDE